MKKRIMALLIAATLATTTFAACGSKVQDVKLGDDGTEEKGGKEDKKDPEPTVVPTESAAVEYEDYVSPEGYFTMKIPSGWEVEADPGDILGYSLNVYDPENPARRFYFVATIATYRSSDALEIAQRYTTEDLSTAPINPDNTTESLFTSSGYSFGYSDFSLIENLGDNGWGGSILQATATYNGQAVEGIFTGSSTPVITMYYFSTDVGFNLEEGTCYMFAPVDEFTNWEPVFTEMFGSITMTDAYMSARATAWANILQTSQELSRIADMTSDMIMSGWESRNNTYDIISQEQSDATLGRERVRNTDTGEIYYADNGWSDSYTGTKYELVESGSADYNLPVSGTISY